jgi:SARP family transcriptional regulator, regulator of embCAB operon
VSARLRVYLTGTVCLEYGGMVVDERQLPARQGRLVLAYLIGERSRPVTRDERGDAIWSDTLPTAWESALSALVRMLRHLLQSLGLPTAAASISGRSERYQIQLPSNTWVDIEAAAQALDEAEGSLRAGAIARAWGAANVAVTIARRPFLPGGCRSLTARGHLFRQRLCHLCRGADQDEHDGARRQSRNLGRYPHAVQGAVHYCR